ncbi:MAG: hypothetical protein J5877_03585 [Clostridia bacterium]|nr:hypothetical protein [Clostridia bacterium]
MVVSNKCFEQFCIFKQKNVRIEETLLKNGKREFVCHSSHDCSKCENFIIPYAVKILNNY